jgi:hypothetical protein
MSKYRTSYLKNAFALADSGEDVMQILTDDVVTRFDVELRATNGATNNQGVSVADVITSFDIMDGSEPIVSLSGAELAGMVVARNNRWVQGLISEVPGAVQVMRFSIDFGRWYGDQSLALDLSKHNNLQMRLKWNLAAIRAVGATGFVTGTARYTVIAHIMEGASNPLAYLSMKRHALFTTVASGIQPVPLPVDKIIKSIGIRSFEAAVGQLSGISHVRMLYNEGKEIPIDLDTDSFLDSLVNIWPSYSYRHVFHAQGTDTITALLKYREELKPTPENKLANAQYVNTGIGEGVLNLVTGTTGVDLATDSIINALVHGYMPFSLAYLQFGTYDDPDSYLQAPSYKSVRLELTQNNAGAVASVILEQVNSY